MVLAFRDEYKFLSNFFISKIVYEGITYRSVEHAYQAIKCSTFKDKIKVHNTLSPSDARKYGRRVHLRESWTTERVDVMRKLLKIKFEKPVLKEKLIALEGQELVEGNYHHDTFWGKCFCNTHKGEGDNQLGILLSELLIEIKSNQTF